MDKDLTSVLKIPIKSFLKSEKFCPSVSLIKPLCIGLTFTKQATDLLYKQSWGKIHYILEQ